MEHVNGPNPPVKFTVAEYGTPALAAGRVVDVIVKGAIVVTVKLCVAVTATFTVRNFRGKGATSGCRWGA